MGNGESGFAHSINNGAKPSKDDRIVIVGAGPAGVHMAHLLLKRGFQNVVILEKDERVGGKCKTIIDQTGVPHELGACWLHGGYKAVMDLAKEYDQEIVIPGGAHYEGRDICKLRGAPQPVDLDSWLKEEVATIEEKKSSACGLKAPARLVMLDDMLKYKKLHNAIFGEYTYTLPPRLSKKKFKKINMNFEQFLRKNGVESLIPIFSLMQAAQGYGILNEIPAFYGLWWITPALIQSFIDSKTHFWTEKSVIYCLKNGYQTLVEEIWKRDKINIQLGCNITKIDRHLPKQAKGKGNAVPLEEKLPPISIEYTQKGEAKKMECEFLILTCPLQPLFQSDVVVDTQKNERKLFDAQIFTALCCSLYKTPVKRPGHRCITSWPEALADVSVCGEQYSERNSLRACRWEMKEEHQRHHFVGYQFYANYKMIEKNPDCARQKLIQCLGQRYLFPADEIEIVDYNAWKYFPHYDNKRIKKGYPWHIFNMQGQYRTWYSGSSTCFESVLDVVNYNLQLVDTMLGKEPEAN